MDTTVNITEETPIENTRIRGFSIKTLIGLLSATAIIVTTVVGGVNKLSGEIKDTNNRIDQLTDQKTYETKYNDLRMQIMEKSIESLRTTNSNSK